MGFLRRLLGRESVKGKAPGRQHYSPVGHDWRDLPVQTRPQRVKPRPAVKPHPAAAPSTDAVAGAATAATLLAAVATSQAHAEDAGPFGDDRLAPVAGLSESHDIHASTGDWMATDTPSGPSVNPASGLPMTNESFDVAGNLFGTDSMSGAMDSFESIGSCGGGMDSFGDCGGGMDSFGDGGGGINSW
ncbi:hypothetical protein VRRI112168_14990 [Vreelandella rituensis]|uniref:Uncharacterized protein n=1 Tax=Vreelandella rituensis TaxID=2282306 RepID=A0A368U9Z9_9GAMM|nr:hypothetical protein [Halomonas rituensis]RCV93771.1 hypothetical protein DU506_01040 [Halomonas rituensis]